MDKIEKEIIKEMISIICSHSEGEEKNHALDVIMEILEVKDWNYPDWKIEDKHELIKEIKQDLENIVCIKGEDKGVILLDHESHTYWDNELKSHVYKHEHFSELGDSLIKLYEKVSKL